MKTYPLRLAALPLILLLAGYPFFPGYFNWSEELEQVSLLTRQIFWVHNVFIVMLLMMQALLLAGFPQLLTRPSPAGLALTLGLLVFWGVRLFLQLFYYDVSHWLGKVFESAVHFGLTGAIAYMIAVFTLALRCQWRALQAAA